MELFGFSLGRSKKQKQQDKAAKSFVGLRGPLSQFLSSDIVAAQDSHIEAFVDQVEH